MAMTMPKTSYCHKHHCDNYDRLSGLQWPASPQRGQRRHRINFLWLLFCAALAGCASTKRASEPVNSPPVNTSPVTTSPVPLPTPAVEQSGEMDEQALAQARLREDANQRRLQSTTESNTSTSSPAVMALRDGADKALLEGDSATANLLLERALRIDPSDPSTYLHLARLRLADEENSQAGALAQKGLSLNPPESVAMPLKEVLLQAQNPGIVRADS